jgi:hypothetical protein
VWNTASIGPEFENPASIGPEFENAASIGPEFENTASIGPEFEKYIKNFHSKRVHIFPKGWSSLYFSCFLSQYSI